MRFTLLSVVALLAAPAWSQSGLHRMWQAQPYDTSPVWAVGFSGDDMKLAIGSSGLEPNTVGRVIVISVDQPMRILGRAEFKLPSSPRPHMAAVPILPKGPSAESYYALRWTAGDASVLNLGDGGFWRVEDTHTAGVLGPEICRLEGGHFQKTLICSDRPNGTDAKLSDTVVNGPFSIGGTRAAISELKPHHRAEWVARTFDTNAFWLTYKRRLIWDFRLNRVIASWTPEKQPVPSGGWSCATCGILRGPFALSHDGKLLAEAANGVVQLYRVKEPAVH